MMDEKDVRLMQETIIQAMTGLSHKEINSIELSMNAKGDPSWTIKEY